MQVLPVGSENCVFNGVDQAHQALAGMISSIGLPKFGTEALAQLNRWMPFCWLSVYTVFESQPPRLHALGSYGVPDGTLDSWTVYKNGIYLRDETFNTAWGYTEGGATALVHWVANEIPRAHRAEIYNKHDLRERLSIVVRSADDGMLAINLYRKNIQPAFSDSAIDAVRTVAPSLLACVQRHFSLEHAPKFGASPLDQLPRREREVCDRLLKGWTQDGIAVDLGLTPSTVKTYRNRAFERMNIHTRHQLFALASESTNSST